MKTQTRDRLPDVQAVHRTDPATVTVILAPGSHTGGQLRVGFYGHEDAAHYVTISSSHSAPFFVRGAAYVITFRLRHDDATGDWVEGTGEHAYGWITKRQPDGRDGYPSDAARATLEGVCRVAAAAALEAIPHGWEIARFQRLQDQRQRDERTADDLREKLAEADRALHATESGLVDSFLRLRDLLPEEELDVLTEGMGDG